MSSRGRLHDATWKFITLIFTCMLSGIFPRMCASKFFCKHTCDILTSSTTRGATKHGDPPSRVAQQGHLLRIGRPPFCTQHPHSKGIYWNLAHYSVLGRDREVRKTSAQTYLRGREALEIFVLPKLTAGQRIRREKGSGKGRTILVT